MGDELLGRHGMTRSGFEILSVLVRAVQPRKWRWRGVPHAEEGRSVVLEPTARAKASIEPVLREVAPLESDLLQGLAGADVDRLAATFELLPGH
ncbi:hypothetical protein [Saccharopolyspora sp. NPDC049357]|uniref:hypothetical protein n=1 Tax=Saccharopolyspora sp. NPDC049357 TaxID=3154507 RepID=UPI003430B958